MLFLSLTLNIHTTITSEGCGYTMQMLTISFVNTPTLPSHAHCLPSFSFFFTLSCFSLVKWLQALSHLRLFLWVNSARLKAFMDSYHAPYKAKHRYWPGLLLVFCFVVLLVFALNIQQDPSINLLAISVGTGMLTVWAWVSGGVYKNWCLDVLEGSFAFKLDHVRCCHLATTSNSQEETSLQFCHSSNNFQCSLASLPTTSFSN